MKTFQVERFDEHKLSEQKKNSAYRRHQLSQRVRRVRHVRIVALYQNTNQNIWFQLGKSPSF